MQLPSITYEGGRTLVHHHQPPGGRCDAGSQASPSAPTTAANRHQRRLASFPFSSLEMIDWSSPHSLPRWRCVSRRASVPCKLTRRSPACHWSIQMAGHPSSRARIWGTPSGCTPRFRTRSPFTPAQPPLTSRLLRPRTGRDAGKLHQICREVASPDGDGFRRAAPANVGRRPGLDLVAVAGPGLSLATAWAPPCPTNLPSGSDSARPVLASD